MEKIEVLLMNTSRTFAMSIPFLDEPLREEVGLAYLLFRILDTFEDAEAWEPSKRIQALQDFMAALQPQTTQDRWQTVTERWQEHPPSEHDGYRVLVSEISWVARSLFRLHEKAQQAILSHLSRTAEGMIFFLQQMQPDGSLVLQDRSQLRKYCYIVAGIVGELLTDLFLLEEKKMAQFTAIERTVLSQQAVAFGEVLQVVNILKDAVDDAKEGRSYLPHHLSKEELFSMVSEDIVQAIQYIYTLQDKGASDGVLAFTALPLLIAQETLQLLRSKGAGAKIGRSRVLTLFEEMDKKIKQGLRPLSLLL